MGAEQTASTFTLDEVAVLVNTVVAGIRTGDNGDDRVYTLAEVAERTKWSLVELTRDCRLDVFEHTHKGRERGMTSRQIALAVQQRARGGQLTRGAKATKSDPADELELARQASQKAMRRGHKQRPDRRAS